ETLGSGLAGGLNNMLAAVPVIGSELAKGGLFNTVATGVVGIGGVLLGHHLSKTHDPEKGGINWGKIIKWGALATSALIALPSVITGVGYGMIYLAMEFGAYETAMNTIDWVAQNSGTVPYP